MPLETHPACQRARVRARVVTSYTRPLALAAGLMLREHRGGRPGSAPPGDAAGDSARLSACADACEGRDVVHQSARAGCRAHAPRASPRETRLGPARVMPLETQPACQHARMRARVVTSCTRPLALAAGRPGSAPPG